MTLPLWSFLSDDLQDEDAVGVVRAATATDAAVLAASSFFLDTGRVPPFFLYTLRDRADAGVLEIVGEDEDFVSRFRVNYDEEQANLVLVPRFATQPVRRVDFIPPERGTKVARQEVSVGHAG